MLPFRLWGESRTRDADDMRYGPYRLFFHAADRNEPEHVHVKRDNRAAKFPLAERVDVPEDTLSAELRDGRTLSVPLAWYPRLVQATPPERRNWRLIGGGAGVHWPDLDEDVSIEGLLAGRPSGESQGAFKRWLQAKRMGRGVTLLAMTRDCASSCPTTVR